MADVALHCNPVNFCQEVGLVYVRVPIRVFVECADVGGPDLLLVVSQQVFDLLHFYEPINLFYCQFAQTILGGWLDHSALQLQFLAVLGEILLVDAAADG